jgi:hypothetical protein
MQQGSMNRDTITSGQLRPLPARHRSSFNRCQPVRARRGRGELIQLLRRHGADPWRPNNTGQTPVGTARLIGNYDIAQFFADLTDPDPKP